MQGNDGKIVHLEIVMAAKRALLEQEATNEFITMLETRGSSIEGMRTRRKRLRI